MAAFHSRWHRSKGTARGTSSASAAGLGDLLERRNPFEKRQQAAALQTLRAPSSQSADGPGCGRPAGELKSLYDCESSVALISTYPRRQNRTSEDSKGVSAYTENLAPQLSAALAKVGRRLVILAEQVPTEARVYEENQALVFRCWRRNALTCFPSLFRLLRCQLHTPKVVLVQFEFNLFGSAGATALLPLFLVMLRICRKRPVVMIHQVLKDLAEMRTHVGLEDKPVHFHLYRLLLQAFYWALLRAASSVAVHEPGMKTALEGICHKPVAVIPHGCSAPRTRPDRADAREGLGIADREVLLLCFGFLAHYKGSDWVVEEIAAHARQSPGTPLRLVLAGGESPNHSGKPYYEKFVSQLLGTAAQSPGHIQVTGYVPEKQVPLYFAAADLAVFPYRTHMSASGPLALACSFGCPFLLSSALRPTAASHDFRDALRRSALSIEDVTFDLQPGQLAAKALAFSRAPLRLEAMRRAALALAAARNWSYIAREYLDWMSGEVPVAGLDPATFAGKPEGSPAAEKAAL